jgi:dihydroxyacetone kinase-like predicted kinase
VGVVATGLSCSDAACGLVEALVDDRHEILTVIEGTDAPPGELDAFLALVADRYPELCVEHLVGGQPVYPLLLALE